MSTQPLNMQFRVFLNRSEGKMWAVGVNSVDRIWTTLWGVIDERSEYTYHFTHERAPKPLNQRDVQDIISSKLAKGYTEVDATIRPDWRFVRDPSNARTLFPVYSLGASPDVAHEPTCAPETSVDEVIPALTLPDDAVLDAAGYTPIGF